MKFIQIYGVRILDDVDVNANSDETLTIRVSSETKIDEVKKTISEINTWRLEVANDNYETLSKYYGYGKLKSIETDSETGDTVVTLEKFTNEEKEKLFYELLYDLSGRISTVSASTESMGNYVDKDIMNIIVNDILGGE